MGRAIAVRLASCIFAMTVLASGALAQSAQPGTAVPSAAKARHYDCSKPGNANKASCKSAAATDATSATSAQTTPTATTTPTAGRR